MKWMDEWERGNYAHSPEEDLLFHIMVIVGGVLWYGMFVAAGVGVGYLLWGMR